MATKDRILLEALRLFSQRGYDAVSVEQIAGAVGIKAPSLYKHYRGKQDIFKAIFEETARRYESFTDSIAVRVNESEEGVTVSDNITADYLVEKVKSLIDYSLNDEYVSMFRRMMTIEQFRSRELSELYSERYVRQMHAFHTGLFTKMIAAGCLTDENPEALAIMYDAPIMVMLGECDRHPEKKEEYMRVLEEHVRLFHKTFTRK